MDCLDIITQIKQLINSSVFLADPEKDQFITHLPELGETQLSVLLEHLQTYQRKQDEMIRDLPPEQTQALSRDLDRVMQEALAEAEEKSGEEEERVLADLDTEISNA